MKFYNQHHTTEGSKDDDYTTIKVKQSISKHVVTLASYEYSFEDEWIKVEHHHHNGLDGKVSRFEVVIFKSAEEMENFSMQPLKQ